MSTLTINWVLPTHREKGGPLSEADIESVQIQMSANNGTNWSDVGGPYPPSELSTQVFDVDPGVYLFRGFVRDKLSPQNTSQAKVSSEVVVEDQSPPLPLQSIEVTVG